MVIVGGVIFLIIIGSSVVACVLQILLHKFLNKKQQMCTTSRENNEIQSSNEATYEEVQLEDKDVAVRLSSNIAYDSVVNTQH